MRRLTIFRLLTLSVMMFATGLITGWWLHYKMPADPYRTVQIGPFTGQQPLSVVEFPIPQDLPHADLTEFRQRLEEELYDDALIIYQRHERAESDLLPGLRRELLSTLDSWLTESRHRQAIRALERFTEHYYQDQELLNRLASILEQQGEQARAIEVLLSSRAFAVDQPDIDRLDNSIHKLSRELFQQQQKAQRLDETLSLFQKLSMLEPDYAFYRYALAESYLALDDTDNAIRELEMLQTDPEYGRRATRLLARLLPPLPEEPEEPLIAGIPLFSSGSHFIVPVTAGEKNDVRLLIDTGATLTTLPPGKLRELRQQKQAVRVGHIELKTASGLQFSPLYRLKQLHIGQFILRDLEVAELELSGSGGSEGLLGMNVLGQFHFQIDQDRNTLTLQPRQ